MEWEVEYTGTFEAWWDSLDSDELEDVPACVGLLELKGPSLPFPYSSGIAGSKHDHMRELRIQHEGRPDRVLYAFDPRRVALLLLGGEMTGNDRWYDEFVPVAERLYDEHLKTLKEEGSQDG